jgi:3-oxoacyl-[acyl-carrier-protein] synthase III
MKIKITAVGSYIPNQIVANTAFENNVFLNENGTEIKQNSATIIQKFKAITGIEQRRYAENQHTASDLAFLASQEAIQKADINPETIDYIIVAHNFGDVAFGTNQSDNIPSLASRVKNKLQIHNPKCVAYDLLFGCPGWIEGVLQANAFLKSGMANRCLVIGAETLSRVTDPHDRDSMIYADGAGAAIIEISTDQTGMLAYESATYAIEETGYLFFGKSYNSEIKDDKYIKMFGRKIYEFALNTVPMAMKECLDKSGVAITDLKKILIHQANEKMDEAIVERFYKLYNLETPQNIMPMNIHDIGNSSVATVPTLFDMVLEGQIDGHQINKGDVLLFASVGAGMNVNAFVYRY